MTQQPFSPRDRLDDYLDGLLTPSDAVSFEQAMRDDPEIAKAVADQRRIDRSLRSSFTPPAVLTLDLPIEAPVAPAPGTAKSTSPPSAAANSSVLRRIGKANLIRIAALVVLTAAGIWVYLFNQAYGPQLQSPEQALAFIEARQYRPYVVCEDDAHAITYTKDRLGQALLIRPMDGLVLVGWTHNVPVIGEETIALLTTVGNDHIVVFMDKAGNDHSVPKPAAGSGKFLHKRLVGNVVLYEISPRPTATVIDRAFIPPG